MPVATRHYDSPFSATQRFACFSNAVAAGVAGIGLAVLLESMAAWVAGAPVALLSPSAAVTVGAAVVVALLARSQLRLAVMPHLNGMVTSLGGGLGHRRAVDPVLFAVENNGLGPAIVTTVTYRVQLRGARSLVHGLDHARLLKLLEEHQLLVGTDFSLVRLDPGASIGRARSRLLGEFGGTFLLRIQRLDVLIEFCDVLGNRYSVVVSAVPESMRPEPLRPPGASDLREAHDVLPAGVLGHGKGAGG